MILTQQKPSAYILMYSKVPGKAVTEDEIPQEIRDKAKALLS
jgi:hypothetical protein